MKKGKRMIHYVFLSLSLALIIAQNTPILASIQVEELFVISKFIKKGDIVFDVGANKGDWSTAVLQQHSPKSIYAFEPIPPLATTLRSLFCNQPVHIFQLGVSSHQGTSTFDYYPDASELSGIYNRPVLQKKPTVLTIDVTSLDLFCNQHQIHGIDFLKIDTEGSEFDVLRGSTELLKKKAIKAIQFEYGGTYNDAKTTLQNVFEFLSQFGFIFYKMNKTELRPIHTFTKELEDYEYVNYLAIQGIPGADVQPIAVVQIAIPVWYLLLNRIARGYTKIKALFLTFVDHLKKKINSAVA